MAMPKYKDKLRSQKRKIFILKMVVFLLALIAILMAFIYFLFFKNLFDVREITIDAPEEMHKTIQVAVDDWLDSGFWRLTKRNNEIFFSEKELSAELSKLFPKLDSIKITKKLPHSLAVSAKERKPIGIWCVSQEEGGQACFYFDKNGIAFAEAQPSAGFLIISVNDKRPRELNLWYKVADDNLLKKMLETKEILARGEISVKEFIIPADSFDEFDVKTTEGWLIYFATSTNIEKQISSLLIFLKEKIKPDQRSGLQYLDLRIDDRIYYK